MMRLRADNMDEEVTISLTPLIDVVFILLIFFMLASSFLDWQQVEVSGLQPGAGSPAPAETRPVMVELDDSGVLVDGSPVDGAGLTAVLQALAARPEVPRIFIKVADGVEMQKTMDLLVRVRGAGLDDFSLLEGQ